MPSKMTFLYGVPLFVGCCTILWMFWDRFKKPPKPPADQICPDKMTDNRKEAAERKMAKAIFISADCWLCVFDLLTPSQLGLGIAMISHRFDFYVTKHFKTRKWTLAPIKIRGKKIWGKGGTRELQIVKKIVKQIFNCDEEILPIPQIQMPRKVRGFEHINIRYIDRNVITFLRRFRPLFTACQINLSINTWNDRILESILRNILPMFGKNIHDLQLSNDVFHSLRKFAPSILNDLPLLRICKFYAGYLLFTEFPCDDSAAASDGQAVAKWLFTPRPDNVPKVLQCELHEDDENLASKIEAIKAEFENASSPVNFIVSISPSADSIVLFDRTNEITREQLTLKRIDKSDGCFLLVRCPIARDESKWTKWEEAIGWEIDFQWNGIDINIFDEEKIGDGLLDATLGPSDQQHSGERSRSPSPRSRSPPRSLENEELLRKEIPCVCSDGEKVLVRLSILMQCGFFAKMLQDLNVETDGLSDDFMFKAPISAQTFKKIVAWMEEHEGQPVPDFEQDPNTFERKWLTQNDFQKNFFSGSFAEVAAFLNAANFLDLQSLFRHATQDVAARLKDRPPEEIREMLQLNDEDDKPLTEEEKAKIREKNVWCHYC